jgi:hypothetical protein
VAPAEQHDVSHLARTLGLDHLVARGRPTPGAHTARRNSHRPARRGARRARP